MIKAVINIFRIPELRNRVLFTLGMLVVYRLGFWIPLPGVDQTAIAQAAQKATEQSSGFGKIVQFASIFTGGSFSQSTIFGLGIMPYITAAIIFQLLQTAVPRLQELKKEGASGQQKITEWTRYATVAMCFVQSTMWLKFMASSSPPMVQLEFLQPGNILVFYLAGFTGLTAGSMFLMWLGEQIDKYGIGNGVSLILTAGIISPHARTAINVPHRQLRAEPAITAGGQDRGPGGDLPGRGLRVRGGRSDPHHRRPAPIPDPAGQAYAGRKVYGGQKHYLPLRVNHAGVMPIIFASSLMIFPSAFFGYLSTQANQLRGGWWFAITAVPQHDFQIGEYPYVLVEILLIYFFSYFWTTVVFSPEDMSKQLRDQRELHSRAAARTADGGVPGNGGGADHLRRGGVPGDHRGHPLDRQPSTWAFPFFVSSFLGRHRPADRGERRAGPDAAGRGEPAHAELPRIPQRGGPAQEPRLQLDAHSRNRHFEPFIGPWRGAGYTFRPSAARPAGLLARGEGPKDLTTPTPDPEGDQHDRRVTMTRMAKEEKITARGRSGGRPPGRAVQGEARERSGDPGVHQRQDAEVLHPHPAR